MPRTNAGRSERWVAALLMAAVAAAIGWLLGRGRATRAPAPALSRTTSPRLRAVQPAGPPAPHPGGYEARDLPAAWPLVFGACLVLALALALGGTFALQWAQVGQGPSLLAPVGEITGQGQPPVTGAPQLQAGLGRGQQADEVQQVRQMWDQRLHSYGWVDQQAGVVHIPIERAMELLAERGLPVRSGSNLPADRITIAADSAAGRSVDARWP